MLVEILRISKNTNLKSWPKAECLLPPSVSLYLFHTAVDPDPDPDFDESTLGSRQDSSS
jgi:hypothetical protein